MARVLLVVNAERPSPDAYRIGLLLKENGYSVDICSSKVPESETSRVKYDFVLDESISAKQYDGVVFLDDGGDEEQSVRLAKDADKEGRAVGGYGEGSLVLEEAGLLKEKHVSSMLPFKPKKSRPVDAPAVRSENIATSVEGCEDGFVVVLVDILGGEIKKIVKGEEIVPAKMAMVVIPIERWPEYWPLSVRLAKKGIGLVVADWFDLDLESKTVKKAMLLRGPEMPRLLQDIPLPSSSWFKQTCLGTKESIEAVAKLESVGTTNVNSSECLKMSSDKFASAQCLVAVCDQGNPLKFTPENEDEAARILLSKGVRWAKPIDSSLGQNVVRVMGNGSYAIVSRRLKGKAKHFILGRRGLRKFLSRHYRGEFIIQEEVGEMSAGGLNGELRFIMRRRNAGWKSSCELGRFGVLISNPLGEGLGSCTAAQASHLVFGDDWQKRLESARSLALSSCIAFQSSLSSPFGVSELAVDITFSGDKPRVIEVNGVPDLTLVEKASMAHEQSFRFARYLGRSPIAYIPMSPGELEQSTGDMDEPLEERLDDDTFYVALRQELSKMGLWPQPDGTIVCGEKGRKTIKEAIDDAKEEALEYLEFSRSVPRGDDEKQAKARKLLLMRVHKLLMLREYERLSSQRKSAARKFAEMNHQPTGPYQYLPEDISVPVPWDEMGLSDYDDYKMKLNRPRRHPEYWHGWKFKLSLMGTPQEDLYEIDSIEKLINEGGSVYPFVASNWE